jgi:hypothetical protein
MCPVKNNFVYCILRFSIYIGGFFFLFFLSFFLFFFHFLFFTGSCYVCQPFQLPNLGSMFRILLPQSSGGERELRPCYSKNCHHVVLYCILLQVQWLHSFQILGLFSMIVVSY